MAMASVYNIFLQEVFATQITSETHPPASSEIQVQLTLKFRLILRCLDRVPLLSFPVTGQKTVSFDLLLLHQCDQLHQVLAPAFTSLGINSSYNDTMVDKIIHRGLEIADWAFKMGFNSRVLRLDSVVHATLQVSAACLDFVMGRVLEAEGSAPADDSDNYGMVPAQESSDYGMVPAQETSVLEMVATFRVEEGDADCTICLEEIEAGSCAARMPCSHIFHEYCIDQWLKQSHYCPICRFEMPY